MFKIKNGRMIGKEVLFDIPEDFDLTLNDCYLLLNGIRFVSRKKVIKYGAVFIEIMLRNTKTVDRLHLDNLNDYGAKIRSEPFEVKRGTGTATAAYYSSDRSYMDVYEEKYILKEPIRGDNLFILRVINRAGKGKKITAAVEDTLQMPNVKAFMDSIQYK